MSAAYQDANTTPGERERIRRQFHTGEIEVVCNIGTLTTGIDWDVRCLILARPTKSEILFVQIIGRALRTAPGKEYALILDHSSTHLNLGMVTDIHHEELDDGRTRVKAKTNMLLPKECPECGALKPPRTRTCPNCGHVTVFVSTIRNAPGKLEELTSQKMPIARTFPNNAATYRMLKHYGQQRGYAPGWSANKYRSLYGKWPRNVDGPSIPPSPELLGWIQDEVRKWAAEKRKNAWRDRAYQAKQAVEAMSPPAVPLPAVTPGTLMSEDDWREFK